MPFHLETHFKIYHCNSCKAEVKVYSVSSQLVACLHCGAAYRFTKDKQALKASYSNTHYRSSTFIDVGMMANIEGIAYRVMARLHCNERCFELSSDEGNDIYDPDDWQYEEYVLESENGDKLYLIYDAEGYFINYPIKPDYTEFPRINSVPSYMQLFENGPRKAIEEHGNVTVQAFAGELDFDPRLRKQLFRYALYVQGEEDFVLEYNAHAEETEAFREKALDEKEVLDFFSGDESAARAREKFGFRKFVGYASITAALLCLLLLLMNVVQNKEVLLDEYVSLSGITDSGYVTKPFFVDEADAVYELTLKSDFSGYQEYEITAHILNEKQNIVNDMDGEFYREIDDEGTHSNNSETEKFRATEKGNYYVRVYTPSNVSGDDRYVGVQVKKGGMAVIFPFASLIIFAAVAFSVQPKHIRNKLFTETGITILIVALFILGIFIF